MDIDTSDAGRETLRRIISKQVEMITGKRNEALERLLLAKVCGMDLRLVEEQSADGLTTTWTFESEVDQDDSHR